jgi:RimJ/RimL family protein N-acetyltransferase
MFCKLSSLEFAKLANFTPPLLPCRSLFTFKISLDQARLISLIAPANVASAKVAERLGEKVEGKTEIFGKEVLIYGIGREQWVVP